MTARAFLTRTPPLPGEVWALPEAPIINVDDLAPAVRDQLQSRFREPGVRLCTFSKVAVAPGPVRGQQGIIAGAPEYSASVDGYGGVGQSLGLFRTPTRHHEGRAELNAQRSAVRPQADSLELPRNSVLSDAELAIPLRRGPGSGRPEPPTVQGIRAAMLNDAPAVPKRGPLGDALKPLMVESNDLAPTRCLRKDEPLEAPVPLKFPLDDGVAQLHLLLKDETAEGDVWYHVDWPVLLPAAELPPANCFGPPQQVTSYFGHCFYRAAGRSISHIGCVVTKAMPRYRVENLAAFAGMLGSLPRNMEESGLERMQAEMADALKNQDFDRGAKIKAAMRGRINADTVPRHLPAKGAFLVNLMPPQELLAPDHLATEFNGSYKFARSVPSYDVCGGIWMQWTRYMTQHIPGALPIDTLQIAQRVFRTVEGAQQYLDINSKPGRPMVLDGLPYLGTHQIRFKDFVHDQSSDWVTELDRWKREYHRAKTREQRDRANDATERVTGMDIDGDGMIGGVDHIDVQLYGWEKVLEFQKVQVDNVFDSDVIKANKPCMLLCAFWRQENVICKLMTYILEEIDGIDHIMVLVRKISTWMLPRLTPVVENFKNYRPGEPNASIRSPPNATLSYDGMAAEAVVF
jgi:hypothetical protein